MDKNPKGGPAFSSLTIRDWFAGQALQALATEALLPNWEVAAECYRLADEMLLAREVIATPDHEEDFSDLEFTEVDSETEETIRQTVREVLEEQEDEPKT